MLVVLVSAPALFGSWVYDDWATAEHPAQDDLGDLLAVFSRDSSAYMLKRDNPWPMGVTYRPLSMASLIAVQALNPRLAWLHHLVSLVLHLACTAGLYFACKRLSAATRDSASAEGSGSVAPPFTDNARFDGPLLIAALFALHPAAIEAYAWINGRSDVLAGAFVAALACALPIGQLQANRGRVVMAALSAAGAAFSKEPAVAAVVALIVACLLPPRGLPDRARLRSATPAAAAALMGMSLALLARAFVTRGRVSGASTLLADPELIPTFARAVRLALEHLLVPLPRAMLCLSYELTRPLTGLDICVFAAVISLLAALVWSGRFRSAFLIAGAGVSLLPVLMVRHLVWLGFDRYLYLPLLLLCLACSELHLADLAAYKARVVRYALLALLGGFGVSSFFSARAYASQSSWLASLVTSRPDDPSGYIMATSWFLQHDDRPRAQQAVMRAPRIGLSPALSHDLTEQLMRLGHPREAIELAERTYRAYPTSGFARFDALLAHGAQGQLEQAFVITRLLGKDPIFCQPARSWLEGLLAQPNLPAQQRASVQRELGDVNCRAPSQGAGK